MLLRAVKNNNIEDVRKALDNEDFNIQDNCKNMALIYASYYGHTDIVKLLLENPEKTNIDINTQDDYGNTALIDASHKKDTDIVNLLL